jgi:hypothetical protein
MEVRKFWTPVPDVLGPYTFGMAAALGRQRKGCWNVAGSLRTSIRQSRHWAGDGPVALMGRVHGVTVGCALIRPESVSSGRHGS